MRPGQKNNSEASINGLSTEERRRAERQRLAHFVWYILIPRDGETILDPERKMEGIARSFDISESGVCIYTSREIPTEHLLFLEISSERMSLCAVGQVKNITREKQGSYRTGIEFILLSPSGQIALRKFCRHEKR